MQALARIAVEPTGRRHADASRTDAHVAPGVVVVLDHAGPRASSWMTARAVGATDAPDVVTGRRPLALDEAGWARVTEAYARAAAAIPAGTPCALGVDDDGLLQATLSPRTGLGVERGLERVLAIHRACAAARAALDPAGQGALDVALVVEELCPGGLDATDGITIARALVAHGARRIYASGGTDALAPLKHRRKGSDERASHHAAHAALASAAWLVGRVDAEVIAVVPLAAPDLEAHALRLGLAGVLASVHVGAA